MQGRLGAVTAKHVIHLRVADEFLMKIRGGEPAHDDRDVRMDLLHDSGYLQRPVCVRQPVKVDAYGSRANRCQKPWNRETRLLHHAHRQIRYAHVHPALPQVACDGKKAERIHLEHWRRWDEVANGTVEDRLLTKVINARRMQEQ